MKKIVVAIICLSMFGWYGCKQGREVDLKIMSYNIRHGEGMDSVLDLQRSAKVIKAQTPDVCGLQEVDDFCLRSDSIGQTNFLAQKTGMKGTFGKFMDFQGGEYGMATLSAKPLISTKILTLPLGKYEPRVAIVHEVQVAKGVTIVFANVHFDWIGGQEGVASRLAQAKALVAYINAKNKAAIITGDFNCTPNSPTMQYFIEQGFLFVKKGKDNLSFQGKGEAKVEIDHVLYLNSQEVKFKVKSIYLLKEPVVSDHRPLVAELKVIF